MIHALSFDHTARELDSRRSGTTEVALVWSKRRHCAAVTITDDATGEIVELVARPGDDPLELYEHPWAYAARRRAAA
jgi:hypothetical protein